MAKSNEKQKTMWDQCYTITETNQFTYSVYKLTGFYMDVTLSQYGLKIFIFLMHTIQIMDVHKI